ncbi:polysaccharide deacetylase family protein [Mesobacillus maritimus]|uniref:polysaccharide deacetylase family protein n=1 Tax=Mesobacillus maritimus TaxID=1643336 RepID=UPI00203C2DBA|nr:polysaccharide deacetylase family protein [Mesobacillus maritimus]MCM3671124.1 polysaccharide deacetylase family protein [Mesobacillus maritimus]
MINEVVTSKKVVALTFDDGPNSTFTPQVLEILADADAKATFFMIGEHINKCPEIVKIANEQGHEIGNHTFTHAKMSGLTPEQILVEIEATEAIVSRLIGRNPIVFRPPYLDYNDRVVTILNEKGYVMVGAQNLEAQDWEQPGVEHIVKASIDRVKPGSILIFHDGFGDRSQTIEAVRLLVVELRSEGYQMVTVSELLKLAES